MTRNEHSEAGSDSASRPDSQHSGRRQLLKAALTAGAAAGAVTVLPRSWTKPIVESVELPVHARTSGCNLAGSTYFNSGNLDGTGTLSGSYTFSVVVSGLRNVVTNVEMDINFSHPTFQNLTATLSGPGLSSSELFSNVYSGNKTANTGLGESLGAFLAAPTFGSDGSPTAPRYKTESGRGLGDFIGACPNGTWTVTLTNAGGTFNSAPTVALFIETS